MLLVFNGRFLSDSHPLIKVDNRSFRYGDGLFETMKVKSGRIVLDAFHFERLFNGLRQLKFELPSHFQPDYLRPLILSLCEKNQTAGLARVRLTVFRGDGGLYEAARPPLNFVIQSWPLPSSIEILNANGLEVDIFPDARKSCDTFSSLKSNNYLPYLMGALYAKALQLNDALILNTHDRIAEATIANIFVVKENRIFTPPLSEGCVAGVTRRFLLETLPEAEEAPVTKDDLCEAEELWLTNAAYGLRWVKRCGDTVYHNDHARQVHTMLYEKLGSV